VLVLLTIGVALFFTYKGDRRQKGLAASTNAGSDLTAVPAGHHPGFPMPGELDGYKVSPIGVLSRSEHRRTNNQTCCWSYVPSPGHTSWTGTFASGQGQTQAPR
jgi:hypothetical protein